MSKKTMNLLIIILGSLIFIFVVILLIAIFFDAYQMKLDFSVSDGIQLIVISLAILSPLIVDDIRKQRVGPIIEVDFKEEPPYCHKTKIEVQTNPKVAGVSKKIVFPIYFFRMKIINSGNEILKNCEVVLDSLFYFENNEFKKVKNFYGINLKWSTFHSRFCDINPERPVYCDLGQIGDMAYQSNVQKNHPGHYDVEKSAAKGLRFLFSLLIVPFSQPNCLLPGKYKFGVTIYGENIKPKHTEFSVDWTGQWQDDEMGMFNEFYIDLVE